MVAVGVTVGVTVTLGVFVGGCGIMMVRKSSGPKTVPSEARIRQDVVYVPGEEGATKSTLISATLVEEITGRAWLELLPIRSPLAWMNSIGDPIASPGIPDPPYFREA